jgi:hypothetical protein
MIVAHDGAEQVQDVFARGGFIKRDPDGVMNIAAQVNLQRFRPRSTAALSATSTHRVSK